MVIEPDDPKKGLQYLRKPIYNLPQLRVERSTYLRGASNQHLGVQYSY